VRAAPLRNGRLSWSQDELIGFAQSTGQQALADRTPSKPAHDLQ
jgi:hypothetical protein